MTAERLQISHELAVSLCVHVTFKVIDRGSLCLTDAGATDFPLCCTDSKRLLITFRYVFMIKRNGNRKGLSWFVLKVWPSNACPIPPTLLWGNYRREQAACLVCSVGAQREIEDALMIISKLRWFPRASRFGCALSVNLCPESEKTTRIKNTVIDPLQPSLRVIYHRWYEG